MAGIGTLIAYQLKPKSSALFLPVSLGCRQGWPFPRTSDQPVNTVSTLTSPSTPVESPALSSQIEQLVEKAAHLLPSQGPIEVFVHHNTLHALEDLPFHEAVIRGAKQFGGQPYLSEQTFHKYLEARRITLDDLQTVLRQDLGEAGQQRIATLSTREELRLSMLQHLIQAGSAAELQWIIAETDTLKRFRTDVAESEREQLIEGAINWLQSPAAADPQFASLVSAYESLKRGGSSSKREEFALALLWQLCRNGAKTSAGSSASQCPLRPRDLVHSAYGFDSDRDVHGELIRLSSAYLDQGYADWPLPDRSKGLLAAFIELHADRKFQPTRWLRTLAAELERIRHQQITAEASVVESLEAFGVAEENRAEVITQTLLSLRGWAGMIWQLEQSPRNAVRPVPAGSLCEFLAIQLLLEKASLTAFAEERSGRNTSLSQMLTYGAAKLETRCQEMEGQHAFSLFQIAQIQGWRPDALAALDRTQWDELNAEVDAFSLTERQRVFQEAFELGFRQPALNALSFVFRNRQQTTTESVEASAKHARPVFQITTCIDDREESFRRHLEEVQPHCETYGAAGFFAVAMNYRGAAESFYKPLCPAVVTPQHFVKEDVGYTFQGVHKTRAELRRRLGRAGHSFQWRSRTLLGGIAAGIAGSLATAPLVAQVLFPHLTSRLQRRFGSFLQPPPVTTLQLERYAETPGPENGGIGYSLDEMADVVVRLLEDLGLTQTEQFSRLFIMCGHGSSSLNNPHESAYCCGACAGKRGGPNARAFAMMANDWRVRRLMAERGIELPEDTFFLGAYHNTCDDSVVFYDLDRLPASHHADFDAARNDIETARQRSAHERCRRFESVPTTVTPLEALRHVEARAQDIAQARPEYNHATNALCVVGRRDWSRGLYLDRRAFLTTYDPSVDDEQHSILLRILSAAIPVCAGINLEYYFSKVDHTVYGAGSKLPHNLAALLGVMEGTSSDLRTGLYQQMVEIHEPLRMTFVIETTREAMLSIMQRVPAIGRLCRGEWVHLAVIEPIDGNCFVFRNGQFEPHSSASEQLPTAKSSADWYRHQRHDLPFCLVKGGKTN